MLLEQKQRQDTRNALSAQSNCQFPLQFVIKTTTCILVLFNIIDACVKKTIETHKCWYNSLDYQFCRILNRRLAPTNLERKAHAVPVLHQLQSVILTHGTISDFRNNLLPVGSNFFGIHTSRECFKFLLQIFKVHLVLQCPFVQLLLNAYLSDGFVCTIVQLCNLDVVYLFRLASSKDFNNFGYFHFTI